MSLQYHHRCSDYSKPKDCPLYISQGCGRSLASLSSESTDYHPCVHEDGRHKVLQELVEKIERTTNDSKKFKGVKAKNKITKH